MANNENSGSCNRMLAGMVALLVIAVILCAVAVVNFYRIARDATQDAHLARVAAEESKEREGGSQQTADLTQQQRDKLIFFVQYFEHVVGVDALSNVELSVVRPTIENDTEMAVVLQTFEGDIASVNQLLATDRQVSNYHDAIVACRELLDKVAK